MLMTYMGSLKSFLYWPILHLFGANAWSVRLPMVLLGGATIFIFFRLAGMAAGRRVALLSVFLLATDPSFLMTQTFDWGPVAIEHFLLVTGCWALFKFGSRSGRLSPNWYLILGFFLFGMALWNKAIFSWALAGLAAAGAVVLWPEVRRALSMRTVALAAAAFLAGALPLVVYNVRHQGATLRQNVRLEPQAIPGKWTQVEAVLQGQSLFGYIVAEEWAAPAKPPLSRPGRVSVWIRENLGAHYRSGFYYVFLALLIFGIRWWWESRAARFSLVFMGVSWLLMAVTVDAGASAHHVILLWPFPILFAAAALTSLPWKPIGVAVTGAVVVMNLLVVNQYISQFERFGAWDSFTDAIYPLAGSLEGSSDTIYVTDWGIFDSLHLLRQGHLKLRIVSGSLTSDAPSADEQKEIREMLADPSALLVSHVREREVFPNIGKHLEAYASDAGLKMQKVNQVADSNGRPIFEIFRLTR